MTVWRGFVSIFLVKRQDARMVYVGCEPLCLREYKISQSGITDTYFAKILHRFCTEVVMNSPTVEISGAHFRNSTLQRTCINGHDKEKKNSYNMWILWCGGRTKKRNIISLWKDCCNNTVAPQLLNIRPFSLGTSSIQCNFLFVYF